MKIGEDTEHFDVNLWVTIVLEKLLVKTFRHLIFIFFSKNKTKKIQNLNQSLFQATSSEISTHSAASHKMKLSHRIMSSIYLAVCIDLFLSTANTTKMFPVDPKMIKKLYMAMRMLLYGSSMLRFSENCLINSCSSVWLP